MKVAVSVRKGGTQIFLNFEEEVWSKTSLPSIAAVSNYFKRQAASSKMSEFVVNFKDTYWVEVPALLALATLLGEVSRITDVKLVFGVGVLDTPIERPDKVENHEKKRIFLSFLRTMGFFSALPANAAILVPEGSGRSAGSPITYNPGEFEAVVGNFSSKPFIQAVTLIPLSVYNVRAFRTTADSTLLDEKKLKEVLKTIGENAALNITSAGFSKGTIRRQRILLSVDKILQESLANIIEHAYKNQEVDGHFAFYARVRNPHSTFPQEFRKGLYNTLDEYDHSRDINWTELYVCDLGVGLETQIEPWLRAEEQKAEKNDSLISELRQAASSSNKFLHASRLLFDHSLSSHLDRDYSRSPQTGFQDLKRVLSDVGYVDITNCLNVNRRRFNGRSQSGAQSNRENYQESRTLYLATQDQSAEILSQFPPGERDIALTAGTHLIYRTQFGTELPSYRHAGYTNIGGKLAARILKGYLSTPSPSPSTVCFDKRFSSLSKPTDEDLQTLLEKVQQQPPGGRLTLFVRLSRNPYKNDVNEWLRIYGHERFGGVLRRQTVERNVTLRLQFVDVLPVYAGWLVERISSFSSTRWMTETNFADVGILTNLLHFAVFEKSQHGYKLSTRSVSSHMETVENALVALRFMDSIAFWTDYENHPIKEVYIDEEIDWIASRRKLGEVFRHESTKIWGFLDFGTSLQSLERFRVCERALMRFMAVLYNLNKSSRHIDAGDDRFFIPTLKSSDAMTQRLASSVNSLFSEIAKTDDASMLILSSIVITGQTQDRAAIGAQGKHSASPIRLSFFDRSLPAPHKNKSYALLHWTPPERSLPRGDRNQKRIFRTPEVSPNGALDIRIPHIKPGKHFDTYQRDRAETYADFELLGALELGHFKKSNRHELVNLNLNALVPLLISTSHKAWSWLVSEFFDKSRDGGSTVVVVYPNQPHAEQIIQEVRHREAAKIPSDQVIFMCAPFLMSRKTEPLIVSPRLELRLAELIRGLEGKDASRTNKRRKIIVRIFDAGVVSGRTLRALKQQIQSVFESRKDLMGSHQLDLQFQTIALIDRSGHSIYGSVLTDNSTQNRRFWRWDVPSLTENGTCRICLAQQRLKDYSVRHEDPVTQAFTAELMFHSSDLPTDLTGPDIEGIDGWRDNLANIKLSGLPSEYQKVIFGYNEADPNYVFLASPLQYISVFAELTRLLHRSDITLNRAMELLQVGNAAEDNIDSLVVLLLASHILLFHESFDRFELLNYAAELFGCLVDFTASPLDKSARGLANTLGMLALYSIDSDALETLKSRAYFCHWLSSKKLSNPHLRSYIHHISSGDVAFPLNISMVEKDNDIWKSNLHLLRKSCSRVVSMMMDIVGDQRIWHKSAVSRRLAGAGVTYKALQPDLLTLLELIQEARDLGVFSCTEAVTKVLNSYAAVNDDRALDSFQIRELIDVLNENQDSFRQQLFRHLVYLSQPNSLSAPWSGQRKTKALLQLFISGPDGKFVGFCDQLNKALKNSKNNSEVVDLFDYLGIGASQDLPFDGCVSLVPSLAAKSVVENALLNSRHASEPIHDPIAGPSGATNRRYVWAWLSKVDNALALNLANHCIRDPNCEPLYQRRFRDFISEGNTVQAEYDGKRKILITKIIFKELVRRQG